MKTMNEYQEKSSITYYDIIMNDPIAYITLGLSNETGEFAGKIKKIFRDRGGEITDQDREALKGELGDILWYLAQASSLLGLKLEDVAAHNYEKLMSRRDRGVIFGDGDDR